MTHFECKTCSYITNRYNNYKKHLLTIKHINNITVSKTNFNTNSKTSLKTNAKTNIKYSNSGIIYLIQPCELVGTNRYKIGCSGKNTLDRIKKGYKSGTRYIHIAECDNPFSVEKEIKKLFNIQFNLIAGKEYYEGDETSMRNLFISIINSVINTNTISTNKYKNTDITDNTQYRYKCISCNYNTNSNSNFKKHLNTITHNNIVNNISNTKKNKIIANDTNINIPIINLNNVKCKFCNNSFISNKTLHNHLLKACIYIPNKIRNRLLIRYNNNPRTKDSNKLSLQSTSNNRYNIINNINTNNINNNNQFNINSLGNESISHISNERMVEIVKGDKNLMKLLCESLYENIENINSYIDIRNNLAFYVDDNMKIKIDSLKRFLDKLCNIFMNNINNHINNNPNVFNDNIKQLFKEKYNIFICLINRDNINYSDVIENKHKQLRDRYIDDVKISMLSNNKIGKSNLNKLETDFNILK